MYNVTYKGNVVETFIKMTPSESLMIFGWIQKNLVGCKNPRSRGRAVSEKMQQYWFYRIGSYRIITKISKDEICVVLITARSSRWI
jgi:mRNA interferase RelE/StbE